MQNHIMVRTISAVIIFTATVISCCISLNFLENTTSSIADNIVTAQKFLKEEKIDLALKEVNLAKEKWESNKKIFKCRSHSFRGNRCRICRACSQFNK